MIRIGKIAATHGLQGGLVLTHIVGDGKWLKKGTALLLEINKGSRIPFFVAGFRIADNETIVITLEEVPTVTEAKRLVSKTVFVDEKLLAGYVDDTPLLWIGFKVKDRKLGVLGHIEDVFMTGTQWLAKLTIHDTEVLIPLVEQTVKKVDVRQKFIETLLPDGLLEVYLEK